ncbi:MAG: hypothetical protein AWU57_209 [Marinobacter sp. T13-3]|nr:MAG: hypothetical protein AWU57_209 [Marinobacter sp. T13-3]
MPRPDITRHQIITFKAPGIPEPITGFVDTISRTELVITFAQGQGVSELRNTRGGMLPVDLLARIDARPHTGTPIPPALQAHIDSRRASVAFKKGDVVLFNYKGQLRTGRLLAGGRRPEVVLSLTETIRIDPTRITRCTPPAIEPPFFDWYMVSLKGIRGEVGKEGFIAVVGYKGLKTVEATCSGGNPDAPYDYCPAGKGTWNDVKRFQRMVRNYLTDHGLYLPCPEDAWIDWAWTYQPSGVSFLDYLHRKTNVSLARMEDVCRWASA